MEILKHILLVDDDPIACEVARISLEKDERYRITICNSGEEALERIGEIQPQMVLLDVMMPGMDGVETLKKLRGRFSLSMLPVAFLTGRAERSHVDDYFAQGAQGVIAKPFNPAKLSDEVGDIWTFWVSTCRREWRGSKSTNLYD